MEVGQDTSAFAATPPTTMPGTRTLQPDYTGPRLFGAPVGDFSVFQTLLVTVAIGAAAFFVGTFAGILGLAVLGIARHHMLDFSLSYRWIGLPFGLLMMFVTGLYLGSILIRRVTRG